MKITKSILISALFLITSQAHAGDPRNSVIGYECDQVNQLVDEFECSRTDNGIALHWNVETDSLSPERRKEVLYQFNRIGLRYVQLGGAGFNVTADFYPDNRYSYCKASQGHRTFRCSLMECQPLNQGQQCTEVE